MQINTNFIPASPGLSLGNANQPWQAHLTDAFSDTSSSNTPFPALTGFLRMASSDGLAWRNAANTGDVTLAKTTAVLGTTPADVLTYSGSGIEGPIISHNLNPAATGEIRLNKDDQIVFRNEANGADVIGLKHNSDDTITIGGSGGATSQNLNVVNETVTGTLTAQTIVSPTTADLSISGAATSVSRAVNIKGGNSFSGGGNVVIEGGDGIASGSNNGGNVSIRGGDKTGAGLGTKGLVLIGDLQTLASRIGSTSVYTNFNGVGSIDKYIGTTVVGLTFGIALFSASSQTAAIGSTALLAAAPAGDYRIVWNAKTTTAAGTSSTLGPLTVSYTSTDGIAIALTCGALIAAGSLATTSAANTTGTVLIGIPLFISVNGATDINFTFGYASNAANAMNYSINIVLERML